FIVRLFSLKFCQFLISQPKTREKRAETILSAAVGFFTTKTKVERLPGDSPGNAADGTTVTLSAVFLNRPNNFLAGVCILPGRNGVLPMTRMTWTTITIFSTAEEWTKNTGVPSIAPSGACAWPSESGLFPSLRQ